MVDNETFLIPGLLKKMWNLIKFQVLFSMHFWMFKIPRNKKMRDDWWKYSISIIFRCINEGGILQNLLYAIIFIQYYH